MSVTNRHGLPQTLVNLAMRDTYTRGAAHISVTELIGSPRIRIMRGRHKGEIVQDVSEMLWSLIGRALHTVVEHGADEDHIPEERLFLEVNGWKVSGGIDLQVTNRDVDGNPISVALSDYKFTSAWAVMNVKPDWERQLNCYAHLVEQVKGVPVTGLSINAIIRDWSRREAARKPEYPQAAAQVVPIRLWSTEERASYIKRRVEMHQDAERRDAWQEDLPLCTDEERWFAPGKLAVVKDGRVRALKLFEANETEQAEAYAAENKAKVEVRPGENKRCDTFCPVSQWCEQYAAIKGDSDD